VSLSVYNTLSRKKEPFTPIEEGFVGMYVCGPTVYGDAHLGHAKSYVFFDVVNRYLRHVGYRVRYVQNITDVGHLTDDADAGEDKLQKQARLERLEPMEVAEKYTNAYFRDMDALGILRPDITPRASGHIPEQIAMIEELIAKGHAYEADGNVYFDVSSDPDYGKLSGRQIEEAVAGTRVEIAGGKRHAADFALWKKAEPEHIMKWPSPWGVGYPGWHIECSAMSTRYLGKTFDIHGGGLENQFPHHECEIAQSECAHGETFVRYWLHNNMVTLNGQKMGKSLGNAISLHQFFSGDHPLLSRSWKPQVIRFFLLQSHYRSTTDFSEPALEAAETGLNNLQDMVRAISSSEGGAGEVFDTAAFRGAFNACMDDDFNTAQAIAVLYEWLKPLRARIVKGDHPSNIDDVKQVLSDAIDVILGIWPEEQGSNDAGVVPGLMELILKLRAGARADKNWPVADQIRDALKVLDIVVEDTPNGPVYKLPKN
jgi:cysteinyl-tRNA synthetase